VVTAKSHLHFGEVFTSHYHDDVLRVEVAAIGERRGRAREPVAGTVERRAGPGIHRVPDVPVGRTGARDDHVTVEGGIAGDEVLQDHFGHRRTADVAGADDAHA